MVLALVLGEAIYEEAIQVHQPFYFFGNKFFLINSTAASSIVLSVDSTSFESRSTINCLTASDFKKTKRIGLTRSTIGIN